MVEQYFPVYRWMAKELGVTGNDLHIYAMIYSFTENRGAYTGGLQYIADYLGITKGTAFLTLQRLLKRDLIRKKERFDGGVKYCDYSVCALRDPSAKVPSPVTGTATPPLSDQQRPVTETAMPPLSDQQRPVTETATHNKEYNKQDNKEEKRVYASPAKRSFGEYGNVLLTEAELNKLKAEFPKDWRQRIEQLSAYMASTGKTYKNHLATIRHWAMRDAQERQKPTEKPEPAPIPGGLLL